MLIRRKARGRAVVSDAGVAFNQALLKSAAWGGQIEFGESYSPVELQQIPRFDEGIEKTFCLR